MGGKSSVTVGYKYYLGMHMVLCYGPIDRIEKIVVGDRVAYEPDISGSGRVYVDAPDLFGGDSREGGIQGYMDVSFGDVETANGYLKSQLGTYTPAYLGVVSLILNKMHLTSMNPYIKPWMTKLKRTMVQTDGSAQWYPDKADIGGQCNPAHIIREVLTNSQWGMGYPESSISNANFQSAADTLHSESFGMWMKWSSAAKIKDVISEIQRTADCILYQGASDGLFRLKMIRDDYDPGNLPVFDETNVIAVTKYEHKGWGETINEVTVEWTDVSDEARGKITPVTVQDLGNIQMQGSVIGTRKQYHGITNASLATRLAQRDLRVLTVPLASLEITINREGWDLGIGDVFKFSWAKYGIVQAFYRILRLSKGTLTDGKIRINAIEDVFGLPDTIYVTPQPPLWTIPNNPPVPVIEQMIFPVGFWDIQQKLPQANINTLDPDFAATFTCATVATTDTFNYQIYENNQAENVGAGPPSSYALLETDIDSLDKEISLKHGVRLGFVVEGAKRYIVIDNELMRLDAISYDDTSPTFALLTVSRGALDTVPVAHSVDSDIWFPAQFAGYEVATERVVGESVSYGLLPVTSLGTLDPANGGIVDLNYTLIDRYQEPYPPGYLQINGSYMPASVDNNNMTFTWQHRNRVVDTGDIICSEDNTASVVDSDIEYWIELLDDTDTTIAGYPKNMGTALTEVYDNLPTLYPQMTVKLWSRYIGAALDSWQTLTLTFLTAGGSQHDTDQHDMTEHL